MAKNQTIDDIGKCFRWSDELLKTLFFIPFGLGSTICNTILIAAILSSKTLRNRGIMRIICALSFTEFVEGAATLLGAVYRITVMLLNGIHTVFSPLHCMLLPQSWMWRWSDFATALMLLSLTLDRLLSVSVPIRYINFGMAYSTMVIGTAYSASALLSMIAWYQAIFMQARLSMLCLDAYMSPAFYSFSKYASSAGSMLSVMLYMPVWYFTKKQLKVMSNITSISQSDVKHRAQLYMTVTIAIQCLATFFLDVIPRAVGIYGKFSSEGEATTQCESPAGMLFLLTKLNSMVAFGVYYARNEIIRDSIINIFRKKNKGLSTT